MTDPTSPLSITRRDFLASSGLTAAAFAATPHLPQLTSLHAMAPWRAPARKIPIGIEMFAVRNEQRRDLPATLTALKGMGYEAVEFFAPYLGWTIPYAKQVRTMLDDLGLRCYSTHNGLPSLVPGDMMTKAVEINQVLGSRMIVLASPPGQLTGVDDWKKLAGQLAAASAILAPHGLAAGFHNHHVEWAPLSNGQRPMDIIASDTPQEFVLQLDVGTCVQAGADPVAWVNAHPGRMKAVHLKDWAPGDEKDEKSFRVLFAEGTSPWKTLIPALEATGGVEFYLMEQEGSRYPELDTARRCLATWKNLRKSV